LGKGSGGIVIIPGKFKGPEIRGFQFPNLRKDFKRDFSMGLAGRRNLIFGTPG